MNKYVNRLIALGHSEKEAVRIYRKNADNPDGLEAYLTTCESLNQFMED